MSIRIIPQDELGSSEKRTADMIPPLLFPRLKNLYNRRAERLRELAENNPLGDYLRFAALIAHAQKVVLYDHPLEMDLTASCKILQTIFRTSEDTIKRGIPRVFQVP